MHVFRCGFERIQALWSKAIIVTSFVGGVFVEDVGSGVDLDLAKRHHSLARFGDADVSAGGELNTEEVLIV